MARPARTRVRRAGQVAPKLTHYPKWEVRGREIADDYGTAKEVVVPAVLAILLPVVPAVLAVLLPVVLAVLAILVPAVLQLV